MHDDVHGNRHEHRRVCDFYCYYRLTKVHDYHGYVHGFIVGAGSALFFTRTFSFYTFSVRIIKRELVDLAVCFSMKCM